MIEVRRWGLRGMTDEIKTQFLTIDRDCIRMEQHCRHRTQLQFKGSYKQFN